MCTHTLINIPSVFALHLLIYTHPSTPSIHVVEIFIDLSLGRFMTHNLFRAFQWLLPNLTRITQRLPSTNIFSKRLFFVFQVLSVREGKKTTYVWAHGKREIPWYTAMCEINVNRHKGVHLMESTTWKKTCRLIKKCVFHLANLKRWRGTSQWSTCAKVGDNHICTSQCLFAVSLTQPLRRALAHEQSCTLG